MNTILWVGPVIKVEKVSTYKVISAAANNWQQRFLLGLIKNDIKVDCLSYLPDAYWPKGAFAPKLNLHDLPTNFNTIPVKYLNIPFIREFSLGLNLIKILKKSKIKFDLVITYNPILRHIIFGSYVKKILKKKWALIIADGDLIGTPDFEIYLSYETQLNKKDNAFLIHGGVAQFNNIYKKNIQKKIILYTGSISNLTGIVDFATSFNKINDEDIELHIYGKGEDKRISKLIEINNKIKLFGFVNENVLETAMQNAWIFINPRNIDEEFIQNTFPSKLLEYLRYGKPIISTKTSSISSLYNDFLYYYDANDINSLKNLINELRSLDEDSYHKFFHRANKFCIDNSWENITKKFLKQINFL